MFCDPLPLQLLWKIHFLFSLFWNGVDLPPSYLDYVFEYTVCFFRDPLGNIAIIAITAIMSIAAITAIIAITANLFIAAAIAVTTNIETSLGCTGTSSAQADNWKLN